MRNSLAALGAWLALALCATGCTTKPIPTPTRSLDRPSDAALVCAVLDDKGGVAGMRKLEDCSRANLERSKSGARLYLLIANTNRGEVALAEAGRQWTAEPGDPIDAGAGMILDTDRTNPGYGFIPVGGLPESIRSSSDGRIAVTANAGDCNLSVIDVRGALTLVGTSGAVSSVSCAVQPWVAVKDARGNDARRYVEARPTWVELSPAYSDHSADMPSGACSGHDYRAFVAFPACELVADVDLETGEIKQAVRVTRDGVRIVGDLSTIRCEAECRGGAKQVLDGGLPPIDMSGGGDGGMSSEDGGSSDDGGGSSDDASVPAPDLGAPPLDLGLPPLLPSAQAFPHTLAVGLVNEKNTLFIGDAVGASIRVVTMTTPANDQAPRIDTFDGVESVKLQGAVGGVSRLRLSRAIPVLGNVRYLYAIGRDNTVRVVEAGARMECETNPDAGDVAAYVAKRLDGLSLVDDLRREPSKWVSEGALRCLPADGTPIDGVVIHRAALATSPGMSLPGGSLPRDVAFVHSELQPIATVAPGGDPATVRAPSAAPGVLYGDFAFILSSAGQAQGVTIADLCPQPNVPDGLLGCDPRNFNYITDQSDDKKLRTIQNPLDGQQPRPIDVMPNRLRGGAFRFLPPATDSDPLNGGSRLSSLPLVNGTTQEIAPFGAPYVCNVSGTSCKAALGSGDKLTNLIAFRRDPLSSSEGWTFTWEGVLPGTARGTGAVFPVAVNGNSVSATVFDNSAAFCTRGTRPGDKVTLDGCLANDDCGPDELCYFDPLSTHRSRGICVVRSAPDVLEATAEVTGGGCRPWSLATLRYRVVRAFQDRVLFEEISLPEYSLDTHACTVDADCADVTVAVTRASVTSQIPTLCRLDGHGGKQCVATCTVDPTWQSSPCGDDYVCHDSQFGDGARCMRAPLPYAHIQEMCLAQLQHFDVRAGDAFVARGDATAFLHDDYPDPADPLSGACIQGAAQAGAPRLLDGRIPLLGGSAVLPFQKATPDCDNNTQKDWLNLAYQNDSTSGTCALRTDGDDCSMKACTGNSSGIPDYCLAKHCGGRALVRYDNPFFSMVLAVPSDTLAIKDGPTPRAVLRSRLPVTGTVLGFSLVGGSRSFTFSLGVEVAAQMLRSSVTAPDGTTIYMVDEGQQVVGTGLRGQVLRFFSDTQSTDPVFLVR